MSVFRRATLFGALVVGILLISPTHASAQKHKELGRMWTFENPPLEFFKEAYGFSPEQPWLDHARMASLRFAQHCSSSFVSPRGLIMTNNHCARGEIERITPEGKNWLRDGYFASSLETEIKVPDLTVQQLVRTEDVTAKMQEGITDEMSLEEREAKLKENGGKIEAAAKESSKGLKVQVVDLYQGGMYQVYYYKVYDDVRMVAFPQLQAAKFGGDPDNFTYPRFSLDYAFVRAYEDGKPADSSKFYFKWRNEGPKEDELVFVTGNPGSTGRLKTVAQVEFQRDKFYPSQLRFIEMRLEEWYKTYEENPSPKLQNQILRYENARKAFRGYRDGLAKDSVMEVKKKAEEAIRAKIDADENLKKKYGHVWKRMEEVVAGKLEAIKNRDQGAMRALSIEENSLEKLIGEATFAVYGTEIPPDATFTLRLSDGVVKGFPMNGTIAPWFTTLYSFYGRYHEFGGKPPFDLPQNWIDAEKKLDLKTPYNLVSTCDIIGGNSGSPMIDKELRIVGLVFDGNIESLSNKYIFTDDVPRTVCVHPAIITESISKVYERPKLAEELLGTGPGYN